MSLKNFSQRLARHLRPLASGKNSFLASIDDAARRSTLGQALRQSANPKQRPSSGSFVLPIESSDELDTHGLASRFGWLDSRAVNLSIGLLTLGRHPMSAESVELFAGQLASLTQRHCFCIFAAERCAIHSFTCPNTKPDQDPIQVLVDGWDLNAEDQRYSQRLQQCAHQLPKWKARFPLVLIDMSNVGHPWTESVGRLCDSVYVMIPKFGAMSPSRSVSTISRLLKAGVRIQGSWSAAA